MTEQASGNIANSGPVNTFGHGRVLLGPEVEFVAPNNDPLYSNLMADVTKEPLVLHLPDTHGRYYVMQFVDAWTNNFAYFGQRATGTEEGLHLLAGPDWEGETPDGMTLVQSPTNIFANVGRVAVQGKADIPNVLAIQQETWVTSLSLYPQRPRAKKEWPDILWILLDDTGFGHLGCYGSPIDTPHIDKLAANGLRYANWPTTALCARHDGRRLHRQV